MTRITDKADEMECRAADLLDYGSQLPNGWAAQIVEYIVMASVLRIMEKQAAEMLAGMPSNEKV